MDDSSDESVIKIQDTVTMIFHRRADGDYILVEVDEIKEHVNKSGDVIRMIYLKDKGED